MTYRFGESTRAELRARVDDLVVLPLGATEQHGDHLPTMTDVAVVTAIAERACAAVGTGVLLAPTLPVGISGHHLPFGGTLSVGASAYIELLVDLVTALRRQGFSRVLFVNGHGGNDSAMRVALERLAIDAGPGHSAAGLSYWDLVPAAFGVGWDPGFPVPGHAGAFETGAMLALRPELVRMERSTGDGVFPLATEAVTGLIHPRLWDWAASDGRTDAVAPGAGEATLDALAMALANVIRDHRSRLDAAGTVGSTEGSR